MNEEQPCPDAPVGALIQDKPAARQACAADRDGRPRLISRKAEGCAGV
jgi:hypothetical protein